MNETIPIYDQKPLQGVVNRLTGYGNIGDLNARYSANVHKTSTSMFDLSRSQDNSTQRFLTLTPVVHECGHAADIRPDFSTRLIEYLWPISETRDISRCSWITKESVMPQKANIDEWNMIVSIVFEMCKAVEAGDSSRPLPLSNIKRVQLPSPTAVGSPEPVDESRTYPTADYILTPEYVWDEDRFEVQMATKRFFEDSNADH